MSIVTDVAARARTKAKRDARKAARKQRHAEAKARYAQIKASRRITSPEGKRARLAAFLKGITPPEAAQ